MRLLTPSLSLGLILLFLGCETTKKPAQPKETTPHTPVVAQPYDLNTLTNAATYNLPTAALEKLQKIGFVIIAHQNRWAKFEDLYLDNKKQHLPSFVTADALLHLYHLIFDQLLQQIELISFLPALKKLTAQLLATTLKEYKQLSPGQLKDAALRAAAFCAVPLRIISKTPTLPTEIEALVHQECALIDKATGIESSPLFNYKITPRGPLNYQEDYSQYIPRGHYTRSPALKKYFKAMMWLGRMTFLFEQEEQLLTILILCRALQKPELKKLWSSIYEPTALLVGPSDNATIPGLTKEAQAIFGKRLPLKTLSSPAKLAHFKERLQKLAPPTINSLVTLDSKIKQGLSGACLMGQRFVVDASIFQQLIHPAVQMRFLPQALDIPAALGSAESKTILIEGGEGKRFSFYIEALTKAAEKVAQLEPDEWMATTAGGWIYTLKPLLEPVPKEAPLFMQSTAWMKKQLQCFMGSWTELKHDTILYAKQAYSMLLGTGPQPQKQKPDTRGYAEPQPELYSRLATLSTTTKDQLAKLNLLPEHFAQALDEITTLVKTFKTIAEKELNAEELSPQEYDEIEDFGDSLSSIFHKVINNKAGKIHPTSSESQSEESHVPRLHSSREPEPASLVADIATAPQTGQVLEVAIGNINELYVIIPIDGKPRIAKGGCYSFYEFAQPMNKRLTDEAWRKILGENKQPSPPAWVAPFTVAG